MAAKTSAERMREKRERDKQTEEERLARLLSRRITLDLYVASDKALELLMDKCAIDEPQDLITRLIHGAARVDDQELMQLIQIR